MPWCFCICENICPGQANVPSFIVYADHFGLFEVTRELADLMGKHAF